MGGLTAFFLIATALLSVALGITFIFLIRRKKQLRGLTESIECFLTNGGDALPFSVAEDPLAPLHNAAAELEARLLLSQEKRSEDVKRNSKLMADISHQLKTPLASLRLFIEMDSGTHLEDEISLIERMERLIYSLLRLERLCANGYPFTFAPHSLREMVLDAWQSLSPLYADRTLTIRGNASLRCDEKWLGEAFLNILKNACQHTSPGGQISVSLEENESAALCVIQDDGGGVAGEDLGRIFGRFYRAGQSGQGAGIGLSIVQEIVARHHGAIAAENGDKGLKITLRLPILQHSLTKT